ncbi:hypothetical protein HDU98_008227 [Podochytrium sp. JEL0797]|nr:hypothetical protein HDU98_008227 [Podochytrium sp. JEL0797]
MASSSTSPLQPPPTESAAPPRQASAIFVNLSDLLNHRYHVLQVLKPRVAQSEVIHAHDKIRDKDVALKILNKADLTEYERWRVFREADLLKTLSHPNIIQLEDFYQTEDAYVLSLEYMKDGDLYDLLNQTGKLNHESVKLIAAQIAMALKYLHSRKVLHRDIKLENIGISTNGNHGHPSTIKEEDNNGKNGKNGNREELYVYAKLIDFSLSTYVRSGRARTPCGTLGYLAPEMMFIDLRNCEYTTAVDMWAFGCLLYAILTGTPPFEHGKLPTSEQDVNVSFPEELWHDIPVEAKDAVSRCLDPSPATRITAIEFLQLPWFRRTPSIIEEAQSHPSEGSKGSNGGESSTSSASLVQPVPVHAYSASLAALLAKYDHEEEEKEMAAKKKLEEDPLRIFVKSPSPPPPGWYIPEVLRTPTPGLYEMLSKYDREIAVRRAAARRGAEVVDGRKSVAQSIGQRSFVIPVVLHPLAARAPVNAIRTALDESDDHRGVQFRFIQPRGKPFGILTVPTQQAGELLRNAGRWGRIMVGRTALFPKKSSSRPDPNLIKALMNSQPALLANEHETPQTDDAIQHLLGELQLPDEDDEEAWKDDASQAASMTSSKWTQLSMWTSNMPDVFEGSEKIDDISIPVREVWFGVWCDNTETSHLHSDARSPTEALLPTARTWEHNQFNLLPPQERGNPTFSPEWKASQLTGMNSYDHPFFEIDGVLFKLKLSADVQIQFFEFDIKSVVLHHSETVSSIYITLAHAPAILDTSETSFVSFSDINRVKFSRISRVTAKHEFYVFNCLVCRITFHPCRIDTINSIFNRVGPSVQSPVILAPGGLYASKHHKALEKVLPTLPLCVAFQISILRSWGLMFPAELVTFIQASVQPLLKEARRPEEVAQLLSMLVRATCWEPFKGQPRPNFSRLLHEIQQTFRYSPEQFDPAQYCLMHQLYVTPTGKYLDGPHLDKTNRVMRQYRHIAHHFLHVTFVEENGEKMASSPLTKVHVHTEIFERRFAGMLKDGIVVAGRLFKFLAFSNSSLKEGRVLFFHEPAGGGETVESIRRWMGDFSDIKIPAKYAARMGQAFSSTLATVELKESELKMIPDVTKNGYLFSDGVGTMSVEIAEEIWSVLKKLKEEALTRNGTVRMDVVPSAFQIRLGGVKGMLSVDPTLQGRQVNIRNSMHKFKSPNCRIVEIADNSSVCRDAYFNRPVILVLEDLGVDKQVFLDIQRQAVRELAFMWDHPEKLVHLHSKASVFGNFVRLWENLGIREWARNEFLRESFDHIRGFLLKEIKNRARIKIPQAWMLFGILDETGTLKEGQIYVQLCSTDVNEVVTGPVIIFRNPIIHPGDIQPALAVDNPRLSHLRNVVVFSQHGARDLPSKLAGGDLDGDMFTVVTNRKLFPKAKSFRAASAYKSCQPIELDHPVTMNDVSDFIVHFMQNDHLGVISRRHLALADQRDGGSLHPDCIALSELHSHAVDFAKTGVPADVTHMASTKSRPDFMYKFKSNSQFDTKYYKSPRVMGLMYRDPELNHYIAQTYGRGEGERGKSHASVEVDPVWRFIQSQDVGWEEYVDIVMKHQARFETEMDRIASYCRPKLTELELWTGCFDMEGRKVHRALFDFEEWARIQFGALVGAMEKEIVEGRGKGDVKGLAAACYYVSNVVKGRGGGGRVFGFLLFHWLVQ